MTGYWLLDHPNPAAPERGDGRYWGHMVMAAVPRAVTVHTSESLADLIGGDAGAENVASYFATQPDPKLAASYHTVVDSDSTVDCLPAGLDGTTPHTAFHSWNRNTGNLGLSFATRAADWQTLPPTWVDAALCRGAPVAAAWCARWQIPIRLISRAQFDAGESGITGHGIIQPEDRTDPGAGFPWDRFLQMVSACGATQTKDDDAEMMRACVIPDESLILFSGHMWTPMLSGLPWPESHKALTDMHAAGLLAKAPSGDLWTSISAAALAQLVRVDRFPGTPTGGATPAQIADELSRRLAT